MFTGFLLCLFPVVFTWPVWPFKKGFARISSRVCCKKREGRRGKFSHVLERSWCADAAQACAPGSYDAMLQTESIPQYSTFPPAQPPATPGENHCGRAKLPLYARVLGWMAGLFAVWAVVVIISIIMALMTIPH